MPKDLFDPVHDEPKLPNDGQPPAAPPTDTSKKQIPIDDPRTDSDIDQTELYDEGLTSAAEADTWQEDSDDLEKGRKI